MSNQERWLVCGTRTTFDYKQQVFTLLDEKLRGHRSIMGDFRPIIVEGCCPKSADVYAEEWATKRGLTTEHHPANQGNYLKRNIEMVEKSDFVICFWDGFSYGSSQAVATAILKKKPVIVLQITKPLPVHPHPKP